MGRLPFVSSHARALAGVLALTCWQACAAIPEDEGGNGPGPGDTGNGNAPPPGTGGAGGAPPDNTGAGGDPAPAVGGMAGGDMAGGMGMGGVPPDYQINGPGPAGSPVHRHGQLQVCGRRLCDQVGRPVLLRGVSSMWLNWEDDGYAENRQALRWMRDSWKIGVIRAAMGIEPQGAFLSDPARARAQVKRIVDNAIAEGVYVIIDWHDHNAHQHRAQAENFFAEMSQQYGDVPNIIYEPFNEPLKLDWDTVLRPYHVSLVNTIRGRDPDNLIILGTPEWSQRVDQAAFNPVPGKNIAYTLHFYSCAHDATLRLKADVALSRDVALFITEWGATAADGGLDGRICTGEASTWLDWAEQNGVSWAAWKLDDCTPDSSCILRSGAPTQGGWGNWLHGHGSFVVQRLLR